MEERRRLPKNVRQVGERDELYRIYLEDYVGTYLEKCMSRQGELTVGVLVGESCVIDGNACLFINGALEVNHVWSDEDQLLFSEYSWERMLDAKSRHFGTGEICGCFVCAGEEIIPNLAILQKLQNRYFPETGNVMLVHSREDSSIYYQNMAGMTRLAGYYIYYERNEAMQSFLVENSQGRVVERSGDEVVVNQFREKMTEKKNMRAPAGLRMAYALCVCLALAVCAIGVNALGSSQKLAEMEQLMTGLLEKNEQVGATISETDSSGGKLTIYDVSGNSSEAEENKGTNEAPTAGKDETAAPEETTPADESAGAEVPDASEAESAAVPGGNEGNPGGDQPSTDTVPEQTDTDTPPQGGDQPGENTIPSQDDVSVLPEQTGEAPVNVLPEGCISYTVQAGDTLSSICMGLYGNHDQLAAICALNGLTDANLISVGQELIVPAATVPEAPPEQNIVNEENE